MALDPTPKIDATPPHQPPPRAFTQGVGTIYQFVGVITFLVFFFTCCFSSLVSKDKSMRNDLQKIGWHVASDQPARPVYSAQEAVAISLPLGVVLGLALAGIGLGLQAQKRRAPFAAVLVTGAGLVFWGVQTVFFIQILRSIFLSAIAGILTIMCGTLLGLGVAALREMRRNPPPADLDVLGPDYHMPYSQLSQDPPEVRLARELHQRRQQLQVQQKELEALERRLKRKMEEK
jgi:hypothetical protein